MAVSTNVVVMRGEPWEIAFAFKTATGTALDMTGGSVRMRIASRNTLLLDKTWSAATAGLSTPTNGQGLILITPLDHAAIYAGVFEFELRAVLADTTENSQVAGTLTVLESLFRKFP